MDDVDWDRTVFSLIAPDALARHLGGEVLRRYGSLGFRPVAWTVLWRRPAGLDAFHERNITEVWKAYLYRLVDRTFAFGPTVALLLRDDAPVEGLASHQRLRAAKGASEPGDAAGGTIRGDLRGVNVMLGLMHSADTPADSRREWAIFGGADGHRNDPADLPRVLALLERSRPAETRGYPEVLGGLRARLLAALWADLAPDARERATALLDGDLAAAGLGERLADLVPADHPLTPVLRCEFEPDGPGIEMDRLHLLLALHGLDLDRWEDLVLATSMRFTPQR